MILSGFHFIRPPFRVSQQESLEWLARAHARWEGDETAQVERMRKLARRLGCGPDRIGWRAGELEDYAKTDAQEMRIFAAPKGATVRANWVGKKMEIYSAASAGAFERWYPEKEDLPDELIHVTCTGYVSPSAAQRRVAALGAGDLTRVTHAYHMGCYAAIPTLRLAEGLLARGSARQVDIGHTELCGLHMDPSSHEPDQWVVQSLFGDGHIRYRCMREGQGLELLALREKIVPDSAEQMTWTLSDQGIGMSLAREVPKILAQEAYPFVASLLEEAGATSAMIKDSVFAVHPGGPRILDEVALALSLRPEQVSFSRGVLYENGNMSSATLPKIWQEILDDSSIPSGKWVVSLAFGPGLTLCGAVFRKTVSPKVSMKEAS